MKAESFVFAIAGTFFGIIVGWVLGSQAGTGGRSAVLTPTQQQAPVAAAGNTAPPASLDQARVRALETVAEQNPKDAEPRVQLGNLYFDAERYTDAIKWYEAAYALKPDDANVSTDLGVAYYYINQPDRAIAQLERSLSVDPKHTKTLLNLGIVKAFGKQDLDGAAQAWQQVVAIAPTSPEGQAASKALEGLRNAHPATRPGGSGGK
jgi:cytochrome c-type biogenesis protein CcmH/NrfG